MRPPHFLHRSPLALSIVASLLSRLVNLAATTLLVRICIHTLGLTGYGLLASLISFTTFFAFGDLGLGLTLMTKVAQAADAGARNAVISRTVYLVSAFAFALIAVSFALFFLNGAFSPTTVGAGSPASPLASRSVFMIAVIVLVGAPFSLTLNILFGLQRVTSAQLWVSTGRILVVVTAALASLVTQNVLTFGALVVGMPVFVAVLATAIALRQRTFTLIPLFHCNLRDHWRNDVKQGLAMATLQFLTFADTGLDALIVTTLMSASSAAELDVATKLFAYIPALIQVGLAPVWPALAAANGRGDTRTRDRLVRNCTLIVPFAALIVGSALVWQGDTLMRLWTGKTLRPDPLILLSLMVWAALNSLAGVQSVALNARQIVAQQLPIAGTFVAAMLLLKVWAASHGFLPGLPLAMAALYGPRLILTHSRLSRRQD